MSSKKDKNEAKQETAIVPAVPQKQKKEKPAKVKKQKEQPVELPLLVEIGFSFSWIFLILVDIVVAFISYSSGATWIDIFVRVVVSTVVVGFILWLLSMNLSNGSLAAALKHIEDEEEQKKEAILKAEEEAAANSSTENMLAEA